jgi:hypothetical protein
MSRSQRAQSLRSRADRIGDAIRIGPRGLARLAFRHLLRGPNQLCPDCGRNKDRLRKNRD